MWKMELHFVPVKGDREDKNFKEKKKQEDNKKKRGPEDKLRSKGLISTHHPSAVWMEGRSATLTQAPQTI